MKKKSIKSDLIVCCGDISIFEGDLEKAFKREHQYLIEERNRSIKELKSKRKI